MSFTAIWTEAQVVMLREKVALRMTSAQIAQEINSAFGTSFSNLAVIGKCHRLDIDMLGRGRSGNSHRPKWHKEHLDMLSKHAELKTSASNIARAINTAFGTAFTRNSVIGQCHRLGIPLCAHNIAMRAARPNSRKPGSPHSRFDANGRERARKFIASKFVPKCDVVASSQPVTLRDLEDNQCHWPLLSRNTNGEQLYCGAPRLHGCYCTIHLQAKNKSRMAA